MSLLGKALCAVGLHRWVDVYRPFIKWMDTGAAIDAYVETYDSFEEAENECARVRRTHIFGDNVGIVVGLGRRCSRCQPRASQGRERGRT